MQVFKNAFHDLIIDFTKTYFAGKSFTFMTLQGNSGNVVDQSAAATNRANVLQGEER